jgi:predicted permease
MDALLQDLRYASRSLIKSPGFTTVAILTLTLGIGVNTAIFSVADALITHPLRGIESDRLAIVAIGQKAPAAAADYFDWARLSHLFDDLAAYRQRDATLSGIDQPERVYATDATLNFFLTIRAHAGAGRVFSNGGDDTDGSVVLSHGFWQRRFGGDANVIGRVVDVDGRPRTIIGIMPTDFDVPVPTDIWLPLSLTPADRAKRDALILRVVGRLKPAVAIDAVQTEMSTIGRQLEASYPTTNTKRRPHVMPLREFVQGTMTRAAIFLLLSLVAVVLLVACANVAGLQLARTSMRAREVALRIALGASRWRIAQLVLAENTIVAIVSGAISMIVASVCINLLRWSMPSDIARLIPGFTHIRIDGRAIGFTMLVTSASAIVAALAPAFRLSRIYPAESLKEAPGSGVGASRQRLRNVFVVAQVAVAFVMLVVSALFVNGLRDLFRLHDLHDPAHVLVLSVDLPSARYPDVESRGRFYRLIIDRFGSLPGVQLAASFSAIPLSNNGVAWAAVDIEGQPVSPSVPRPSVVVQRVSPDYFALLRIPLQQGRVLNTADRAGAIPVAVISESFAKRYWPRQDALGKRVNAGTNEAGPWSVIVGVVGDVLYDWTNRVPEPAIYFPVAQTPPTAAQIALRVNGDPNTFIQPARGTLAALDPLLPAFDVMSLSDAIHQSLAGHRQIAAIMGMLGGLALIIAVIGLYGVISYLVSARMREFGVRLALGARRIDIFGVVMLRSTGLAAIGIGLGWSLSIAMSRVVRRIVFGAGDAEPLVWFEVASVLAAVMLFASYVPARRATKADPVIALRAE